MEDYKDFEKIGKFDDVEVYRYFIRAMPKTSLPVGDFDENGQRKPDGKLYNLAIKSSSHPNSESLESWANDKDPQLKRLITEIEDGCKNNDTFEDVSSFVAGFDSDSEGDNLLNLNRFGRHGGFPVRENERTRQRREERKRQKAEKERL